RVVKSVGRPPEACARTIAADAVLLPGSARGSHHPGGEPRAALDPAALRPSHAPRDDRIGEPDRALAALGPDPWHPRHRRGPCANRYRPDRRPRPPEAPPTVR